jgi:formate dehydrogenase iron-sulfur subunit
VDYGGGTASGRPVKAVQVGGPLGAWVPEAIRHAAGLRSLAAMGAMLGHGGVVVADDTLNMARMARFAMQFCADRVLRQVHPCRIGSTRGVEVIDRLIAGTDAAPPRPGAAAARPVRHHAARLAVRHGRHDRLPGASALKHFPPISG